MIIEVIIKGLLKVAELLVNLIKSIFPFISIPEVFGTSLGIIITTTTQANNFIHFMLGNTAHILLTPLLALLGYQYVVYPIITTILGVFINKAE